MAISWEKITVGTVTATGITPERQARRALITVETNSVRIRYDGGAATSTDGHLVPAGSQMVLLGTQNIIDASLIAITADATVQITYEAEA